MDCLRLVIAAAGGVVHDHLEGLNFDLDLSKINSRPRLIFGEDANIGLVLLE